MPRTYKSSLRDQQVEQTRELILDRAMTLLADPSLSELTVADAAARAGVSVRTAYRYFPTKEALFDGLNDWFMRRWGPSPRYPERFEALHEMVGKLFLSFRDNEQIMRASFRTRHAGEVRARRKQQQVRALTKLVENEAPQLAPAEVRRIAGALHILLSADNYLNMRDAWGFSAEEAIESARWGIDAIAAKLRRKKGGS